VPDDQTTTTSAAPAASQPPSVAALVKAISEDALAQTAVPTNSPVVGVALAKPQPITRVLVITAMILIVIFSFLMLRMFTHVGELLSELRAKQERDYFPVVGPMPPSVELRDAQLFSAHLKARPQDALLLYAARVQAFHALGEWDMVLRTAEEAHAATTKTLPFHERIYYADALVQRERLVEAQAQLNSIPFHQLSAESAAMAHDVLSRLVIAEQRQDARRRTSTSVAHPAGMPR
jgi:hypothetical protein